MHELNYLTIFAVDFLHEDALSVGAAIHGPKFVNSALRASVRALKRCCPDNTTLYSIDTNRYLGIIPALNHHRDPTILKSALDKMRNAIKIDEKEFVPSPRMGFISTAVNKDDKPNDLIRLAISSLEQAKEKQIQLAEYILDEDIELSKRFKLLSELPCALEDQSQFHLNFQPLIEANGGECVEFECLMRWNHPEEGNVPPATLISWIEKTPLMQDLTCRVIELAMNAYQKFAEKGMKPKFAVNLSATDLFSDKVFNCLEKSQDHMPVGHLILEITETALICNLEIMSKKIRKLCGMGFVVHVDDFGVGQSSLSYLTHLPAHTIKMDRSFVTQSMNNPKSVKIACTISTLAKELGFEVILEGIEDNAAYNLSRYISPHVLQGFGIARPMDLERSIEWLKDYRTNGNLASISDRLSPEAKADSNLSETKISNRVA